MFPPRCRACSEPLHTTLHIAAPKRAQSFFVSIPFQNLTGHSKEISGRNEIPHKSGKAGSGFRLRNAPTETASRCRLWIGSETGARFPWAADRKRTAYTAQRE